jgi:PAS domain S-box-containing protein
VGTIGVARDITLRKQAESEIAAAEAHYRRLVATSPYGMYALDAEGRLVDANQALATILERPAEELIGMSFLDVVAPEGRDLADPRVRRPREGRREVDEVESWVVRPSGERRRVIIRSIAVDEEGAVARSHGVVRDVTEERAMEAQLRRAERLASVGSLVGGVAHELNNPLAAIKGFAQLMMLDEHSPEDREALETMLREADRAASIVSHLRVLAQQTVDDVRAQTAVDLNDVVRHVLKVRRYTLETGNVRVVEELDPALPPVWANRDQMEQVAANLILNAEQAMAGQARPAVLTVRTLVGGSRVCLDVSDTGPGIPREHRERIFDPFWTTKPPGQGTGLGLSLVHGFVAETGGEVSVESEMGVGSRFRVSVPALGAAGADPAAPAEAEAATAARPVRALLVDDEEAIRRSLRRFLTRRGIEVQEAADGEEALRHIRDQPADRAFDVILSDLRMPGLSGDRLLETLRADGRGYDRRLIVMTGDSASSEAAGILAAVGVPVIFKPFDLLAIERAIRERVEGAG